MDVDAKVLARLDELITNGQSVIATRRGPPPKTLGFDDRVDSTMANQWVTSCQSLLQRVFGEQSAYYVRFCNEFVKAVTYSPVVRALGIIQAAREDYAGGYLFNVRKLIQAEVFDEFLDQAQHLYDAGYFQPAAVVAGAVLEDGLRKLCEQNSIPLADKPKLDTMNADLAKAGVYNKLTQKQVTVDADLRNKAAHGQWDQFTKDDVFRMLGNVRSFMEKHFT